MRNLKLILLSFCFVFLSSAFGLILAIKNGQVVKSETTTKVETNDNDLSLLIVLNQLFGSGETKNLTKLIAVDQVFSNDNNPLEQEIVVNYLFSPDNIRKNDPTENLMRLIIVTKLAN